MTAKRWMVGNAALAVAAAVLAAGCGDAQEPVKLVREEAEALALKVGAVSSMAWLEKLVYGSGEYDFVIPCSTSGNMTFSGTSKEEMDRGWVTSFDVDGTQRYNTCAEVVEGGETMTLSGTVNEILSLAEEPGFDVSFTTIKGTWRGTVVLSTSNGRSGECEVDLALDASHTWSGWSGEEILQGRIDGTFCTLAVDAPLEERY